MKENIKKKKKEEEEINELKLEIKNKLLIIKK